MAEVEQQCTTNAHGTNPKCMLVMTMERLGWKNNKQTNKKTNRVITSGNHGLGDSALELSFRTKYIYNEAGRAGSKPESTEPN